jgi:hypothetical protein
MVESNLSSLLYQQPCVLKEAIHEHFMRYRYQPARCPGRLWMWLGLAEDTERNEISWGKTFLETILDKERYLLSQEDLHLKMSK